METKFGADFRDVRVHPNAPTTDVGAAAYTVGEHIAFGPGRYNPNREHGQRLLAHELAHVLQQRRSSSIASPEAACEKEADLLANRVISGFFAGAVTLAAAGEIQRRQLDVGNGRTVGDAPGAAANTREDVLDVMDRMHFVWLMTTDDYAAEYPAVASQPSDSVVATSRITKTLAALDRALSVDAIPAPVAKSMFNVDLSGGVGPGQANARSDVIALQHGLHAAWDLHEVPPLAFKDAQTEIGKDDPVDPARLNITREAIRAAYDRFIRGFAGGGKPQKTRSAIPTPGAGAPPQQTRTGGGGGISWELSDAPTAKTPEERVASWLRSYRTVIEAAEARHGVDRRAIAAAIAWEALKNVAKSPSFRHWTGPGKVHSEEFTGKAASEQVESAGYLPTQPNVAAREKILGDPVGAISYIAAIMQAHAEAAAAGDYNLRADPPMLCFLYHAWRVDKSKSYFGHAKRAPAALGYTGSKMALWIADEANLEWVTKQVGSPAGALSLQPRGY